MYQHQRLQTFAKYTYINFCLPDDRRDEGVVAVVHPGEEVVLDLVVEAAVQVAQERAAHVRGGRNLE